MENGWDDKTQEAERGYALPGQLLVLIFRWVFDPITFLDKNANVLKKSTHFTKSPLVLATPVEDD